MTTCIQSVLIRITVSHLSERNVLYTKYRWLLVGEKILIYFQTLVNTTCRHFAISAILALSSNVMTLDNWDNFYQI